MWATKMSRLDIQSLAAMAFTVHGKDRIAQTGETISRKLANIPWRKQLHRRIWDQFLTFPQRKLGVCRCLVYPGENIAKALAEVSHAQFTPPPFSHAISGPCFSQILSYKRCHKDLHCQDRLRQPVAMKTNSRRNMLENNHFSQTNLAAYVWKKLGKCCSKSFPFFEGISTICVQCCFADLNVHPYTRVAFKWKAKRF